MEAYQVVSLLNDIAETSSRSDKEHMVRGLAQTDMGKFVLNWAYNPFITYGITAAPSESDGKMKIKFRESLVEPLLKRLAARELTGNAAEREVADVMAALDKDGARLLFLILSKDLKCGIGETTINTVMPGLIPVFSVMRAHKFEAKKVKSWPRKGEFKLDGNRNTFLCHDGHGAFFTRSGKIVPALDHLVAPVLKLAAHVYKNTTNPELKSLLIPEGSAELNFMLDGEAMMGLFGDTGALRRKKNGPKAEGAELHLYDIMSYADFDAVGSVGKPLKERRKLLEQFVSFKRDFVGTEVDQVVQIVPQYFVTSAAEADEFYERAINTPLARYLARGDAEREAELLAALIDPQTGEPKMLEGAMIKDPDGLYDKKKSNGWLKMKAEDTEDLLITGAYLGNAHTELENTLGGIQVDRDGVRVDVGGGFKRPERDELWDLWNEDVGNGTVETVKKSINYTPHAGYVPKLVGRMVEVRFHEVTPDGSLRHPRFIRFRDDKQGEIESKEAA